MAKKKVKSKKEDKKPKEKPHEKKVDEASGIFVPAGLLIGMGIGFAFDALVAGLFVGLGAGLLIMALIKMAHLKR